MTNTLYDKNALAQHLAQGTAHEMLKKGEISNRFEETVPVIYRYVVMEVISDPTTIDEKKLSYWQHELGVSNIKAAAVAPRNSLVCQRVLQTGVSRSEKSLVIYPFFPSHLAMPAKIGEHVWVIFEAPSAKENEIGFWFCRIQTPEFVDDVNYTHNDRQMDVSFAQGTRASYSGAKPVYEFPNGAVVNGPKNERRTIPSTISINGNENAYVQLLNDKTNQLVFEPVPRYKKRPEELSLEGSNNTLIVLGTDRIGPASTYVDDPQRGMLPVKTVDDQHEQSGMIDIVVGRGQTPKTSGKTVSNSLGKKELGKSKSEVVANEGDPDLVKDTSRVRVSQKTIVDKALKIDTYLSDLKISTDPKGGITIKSDQIRLVAREDLVIFVGADGEDGTKIVIRKDGNIVMVPNKTGVIKLGGEDANLALLCSDAVTPTAPVAGVPIVDTMGGSHGAGGSAGKFATKVLVK